MKLFNAAAFAFFFLLVISIIEAHNHPVGFRKLINNPSPQDLGVNADFLFHCPVSGPEDLEICRVNKASEHCGIKHFSIVKTDEKTDPINVFANCIDWSAGVGPNTIDFSCGTVGMDKSCQDRITQFCPNWIAKYEYQQQNSFNKNYRIDCIKN